MKGSVAKHTAARHLQLPGTIKFEQEREYEQEGRDKRERECGRGEHGNDVQRHRDAR